MTQVTTPEVTASKIDIRPGNFPHTAWINLHQDGRFYEVAVVKKEDTGAIRYIQVNKLDRIDQQRLARIVQNPRAGSFALFDLMGQTTLQNGVNALEYFHQFVEILAPNGKIFKAQSGVQISGM